MRLSQLNLCTIRLIAQNVVHSQIRAIVMDPYIMKTQLIKISKINNLSIINFKSLEELQKQNLILFKDDVLKVNKKHMIKLNSILDYLIND